MPRIQGYGSYLRICDIISAMVWRFASMWYVAALLLLLKAGGRLRLRPRPWLWELEWEWEFRPAAHEGGCARGEPGALDIGALMLPLPLPLPLPLELVLELDCRFK